MIHVFPETPRIAVIGLGYVGLPLAIGLSRHFDVVGFDIDRGRVEELRAGRDRTGEIDAATLRASSLAMTAEASDTEDRDLHVITVPTPVDSANRPDLAIVRAACATVGAVLRPGSVVVLESTVYPGVTETVCGPILREKSGLEPGRDFFLGYSPERINPGDKVHTVDKITKVVAAQTPEAADFLAGIYGRLNGGDIFVARDIRTAEAAKVIENAQRDINIAFVNEVATIFRSMGLSVYDVLEAAGTKWNFLPFKPGLVGGHCIGVDPYYLAHSAQQLGHHPEVILAGRRINDGLSSWIAADIDGALRARTPNGANGRVLVLGITFKENVPDLRNTKAIDLIRSLKRAGHDVVTHDPVASPDEAAEHYGVDLTSDPRAAGERYDAVVLAVAHDAYRAYTKDVLRSLVRPGGLVADIKGLWRGAEMPDGVGYWVL